MIPPLFPWLFWMGAGFLAGGIMFSQLTARLLAGRNLTQESGDHNPGAVNAFLLCGPAVGTACLLLDLFKGFVPVFMAKGSADMRSLLFAGVIAAPVLGHAVGLFNHFRGGKLYCHRLWGAGGPGSPMLDRPAAGWAVHSFLHRGEGQPHDTAEHSGVHPVWRAGLWPVGLEPAVLPGPGMRHGGGGGCVPPLAGSSQRLSRGRREERLNIDKILISFVWITLLLFQKGLGSV